MSDNKEMLNQEDLATPILDEETPQTEELIAPQKPKKEKPAKEKKTTGKETFSRVRAIVGVLLIVAAIVTAIILVPVLEGQEVSYNILYAKTTVPAGVEMTDENIGKYFGVYTTTDHTLYQASIPADKAGALLRGNFTARDIYPGKYPSAADFSKTNLLYNDRIPAGYELIAINVPVTQNAVAFQPKAGDIIKFYRMATYVTDSEDDLYFDAANIHVPVGRPSGTTYADTYDYLQYVQVYAALDGELGDSDAKGTTEAIYLIMAKSGVQAQQLIECANSGNYYWSLVSSGDKARAEALLKLQDEIIESGIAGAGRTEQLFKLEDLTAGSYVPAQNATVRFAAAVANGQATALDYPAILKYVTVLNIYDQNMVNMKLAVETEPGETRVPTYVGLNLSKSQTELLQKLIDEGQVFIKEVKESQDKIISGFDAVSDLLWSDYAQELLQNATSPELPEEGTQEGSTETTEPGSTETNDNNE